MKVAAEWLNDYLPTKLSTRQLAEGLELAGIEVEQIISSKKLDSKIVIAGVKKVVQHPDADRLKLVEVSIGSKTLNIVCGALNVKAGMKAALALVGATLPDGTVIEKASIRGQTSNGMLCSAQELGLSDDHSGILELDADLPLGKALQDLWGASDIIEVKTHANRSDLQSVVGLAREIAAITDSELKMPSYTVVSGQGQPITVKVEALDKTPRYMALDLVIEADKATPGWLTTRLVASGVRPISLIVDVTNYVMLELGQPLHAFDAAKVKLPIVVRAAKNGEVLKTLDGVERKLSVQDLVIADANGAIALAGVMGGAGTQIIDTTRRIILESATFDGVSVRKTAVRHGLRTDASARFERRLPVQLAPLGLDRAAVLLAETAGAKPSAAVSDNLQVWPWIQHIGARPSRLSQLFGTKLDAKTIVKSLNQLGFVAEKFDVVAEARKHLGKPYVWGAKFKTHGTKAFDCSYLTDYIYSLVGLGIGHTAHQQFKNGQPVHTGELKPGDLLFRGGPFQKLSKTEREGVSHSAIYIGEGKIIHAVDIERNDKAEWVKRNEQMVVEEAAEVMLKDPEYLGARRYAEDLDDYVAVTASWWRPDVKAEEDVLEEVARIVGYDSLPAKLPPWQPTKLEPDGWWPRVWQAKATLKGLGLFEVMTYSFVSEKQLSDLGYEPPKHLKIKNPLSSEQAYMRSELLPSLVATVAKNAHYSRDFGLFELSKVFKANSQKAPEEPTHLAVISRQGYGGAKAALDVLAQELRLRPELKLRKLPAMHPARSAQVWLGSRLLGVIGELHPDVLRADKIDGELGYLELDFGALVKLAGEPNYQPISRFPSVLRDLSRLVKDSVTWAEVRAVIEPAGQVQPTFLSDYYGAELVKGYKTIAVRLELSSPDKTLTDAEADKRLAEILKALERKLGAKLR